MSSPVAQTQALVIYRHSSTVALSTPRHDSHLISWPIMPDRTRYLIAITIIWKNLCQVTTNLYKSRGQKEQTHLSFTDSSLIYWLISHSPTHLSFTDSSVMYWLISHSPTHLSFTNSSLIHRLISHSPTHLSFTDSSLIYWLISHSPTHLSLTDSSLIQRLISHLLSHISFPAMGTTRKQWRGVGDTVGVRAGVTGGQTEPLPLPWTLPCDPCRHNSTVTSPGPIWRRRKSSISLNTK